MNRKHKIIVSLVGIAIVLLALVGLTYGYYLARINGNTNVKSILTSTKKLELTYSDNSSEILGNGNSILPSEDPIGTKTFVITNKGTATTYSIVIEDLKMYVTETEEDSEFESNDFRYTLTCKTKNNGNCSNQIINQSVFPLSDGALLTNKIEENDIHTYTLTMYYIETEEDQSADMGKSLSAKINIIDPSKENPYRLHKDTLAFHIIDNAINRKNGTNLISTTKSIPAEETSLYEYVKAEDPTTFNSSRTNATSYYISYANDYSVNKKSGKFTLGTNESPVTTIKYSSNIGATNLVGKYAYWSTSETSAKNISNLTTLYKISTNISDITSSYIKYKTLNLGYKSKEKELSVATDDYGVSYYFRGNPNNNYLSLNNMCFRVVRIEGDGSIKLILEDQDESCSSKINGNWDISVGDGETTLGNYGYDRTKTNTSGGTIYQMSYLNPVTDSTYSMATVFKKFQKEKINSILNKLKAEYWCLSDKAYTEVDGKSIIPAEDILTKKMNSATFYYDSRIRLHEQDSKDPMLKCNGTVFNKYNDSTEMYVGTLTADEIAYAGGKTGTQNQTYYLINKYQINNKNIWWTLTPSYFNGSIDRIYTVDSMGKINSNNSSDDYISFRPSIVLKAGTEILSGDGTIDNPYIIK